MSADLSRRSFLVGSAAAGLVLGYSAVPGIDQALAAPRKLRPQRLVLDRARRPRHRDLRQGRHGPAHRLHHGADRLRGTRRELEATCGCSSPPTIRSSTTPCWARRSPAAAGSTMMNFDAMSRAGAAGRMALTEAAAAAMGVPAGELVVRDSAISHAKSKKSMSFADIVKSGKATKTFTPDELKAIKLKTPGSVHDGRRLGAAARHPRQESTARPSTASTSCCRAWSMARSSRRRCASAPR